MSKPTGKLLFAYQTIADLEVERDTLRTANQRLENERDAALNRARIAEARAKASQGVEAVEVVAHMYQHEETGVVGFVDQQQVEWGFEKINPRLHLCGELMTVAQHQRILAAAVGSAEPVAMKTHGAWDGLDDLANLPDGTKLYTHPADQVADGVTRELLERVAKPVETQYDRDQRWIALEELRAQLAKPCSR